MLPNTFPCLHPGSASTYMFDTSSNCPIVDFFLTVILISYFLSHSYTYVHVYSRTAQHITIPQRVFKD